MPGALVVTGKTGEHLVLRAELSVRPVDELFNRRLVFANVSATLQLLLIDGALRFFKSMGDHP